MRELISKEQEAKKRQRNQIIVGMVLIFVMFFSVIGYGFVERDTESIIIKKINYNGFEFTNQNGFWVTEIDGLQFAFKNNPNEIEKIDSKVKGLENYYEKPLYLFSENRDAEAEIYMNLNSISQRVQKACPTGKKCDGDLPVKTCDNNNFIIIEENETTEIRQDENCVFIKGSKEKLTELSDVFLFKTLNIEQ